MLSVTDTFSETIQLTNQWLEVDKDAASSEAVKQLLKDQKYAELKAMMSSRMEFGTAGIRGLMGPGWGRMNAVTVQQTVQGLCAYLKQDRPERLQAKGVVIGYDARHNSKAFAVRAAAVFISQNVRVRLFSLAVPTPFVAGAVTYEGYASGIMITASHNPKQYNGLKVYSSNGCQIIPPESDKIAEAILANVQLWPVPERAYVEPHILVRDPLPRVVEQYYDTLTTEYCFRTNNPEAESSLVYTALHGLGARWVSEAFRQFGLPQPILVPSQYQPDPDFPTVKFPNPEEGGETWADAFAEAETTGARLVLANDPDVDRLAVAERSGSGWRRFTGNEIGILLADWMWSNFRQRHPEVDPARVAVLTSTVSSKMLAAMAKAEGLHFEETLTGFKWLGNRALALEARGFTVLFAFEEAIGYMLGGAPGGTVKDKDGISAAVAFAEMAADLRAKGLTVADQLTVLGNRYGFLEYRSSYFTADSPDVPAAVFERLRQEGPPQELGGLRVTGFRDLGTGVDTTRPGNMAVLPWKPGDMMVTYYLGDSGSLTLRTSGTEVKLKWYLEVPGEDAAAAAELANKLEAVISDQLILPEQSGLRRREG